MNVNHLGAICSINCTQFRIVGMDAFLCYQIQTTLFDFNFNVVRKSSIVTLNESCVYVFTLSFICVYNLWIVRNDKQTHFRLWKRVRERDTDREREMEREKKVENIFI